MSTFTTDDDDFFCTKVNEQVEVTLKYTETKSYRGDGGVSKVLGQFDCDHISDCKISNAPKECEYLIRKNK